MNSAELLRAELVRAARALGVSEGVEPLVERPREAEHGDLATNLAMQLAKPLKKKPRDVAEALRVAIDLAAAGVSRMEIAGPGFINFWLDESLVAKQLKLVLSPIEWSGTSEGGLGHK